MTGTGPCRETRQSDRYPERISGKPEGRIADRAIVVADSDKNEYFSDNLARDFIRIFRRKVIRVDYPEDGQRDPSAAAADICKNAEQGRALVFYAGRGQQVRGLLDAMANKSAACGFLTGGRRELTFVNGSGVTAMLADPSTDLGNYPFLTFYYAAFSNPAAPPPGRSRSKFANVFDAVSRETTGSGYAPIPVDSDAAAGGDALRVATTAIENTYAGHKQVGDFQSNDVYQALIAGVEWRGDTGPIRLDGSHKYPEDKEVYLLQARPGKPPVTVLACGNLSDDEAFATTGPVTCP